MDDPAEGYWMGADAKHAFLAVYEKMTISLAGHRNAAGANRPPGVLTTSGADLLVGLRCQITHSRCRTTHSRRAGDMALSRKVKWQAGAAGRLVLCDFVKQVADADLADLFLRHAALTFGHLEHGSSGV